MSVRRQHHKGKKRAGTGWHKGRAQGRINDRLLAQHERLEARAADAEAALRAETEQLALEVRERGAMIQSLRHVAPFVPCWWPA